MISPLESEASWIKDLSISSLAPRGILGGGPQPCAPGEKQFLTFYMTDVLDWDGSCGGGSSCALQDV